MNVKKKQTMSDDTARRDTLEQLKNSVQARLGNAFEVVRVTGFNHLMTEVLIKDAQGRAFQARVYNLDPTGEEQIDEIWQEHGEALRGIADKMPLRNHGLQKIGRTRAMVATAPEGMDLHTYLKQVGLCRSEFALRVCVGAVKQLGAAAAAGCLHQQLQPSDIVITPQGGVVVKNIGLGPFEQDLASRMGMFDLAPGAYLAPEQFNDAPPSLAADTYRLCLILYRMVAGRLPFDGNFEQIREGHKSTPMPNPQAFNKQIGVGLARVLMHGLGKEPEQRFKSWEEIKNALAMLHPAAERAMLTGAPAKKLSTRDMEKIKEDLAAASEQINGKDFKGAVKTLEAILMMAGPVQSAVKLFQQAWEGMYTPSIDKFIAEANKRLDNKQVAGTLSALNVVLALAPRNATALKMQARIFEGVKQRILDVPNGQPIDEILGRAAEAKSGRFNGLALNLWAAVMMTAKPKDEEQQSKLKFAQQVAAKGLQGLMEEPPETPVAPPASAITQAPPEVLQAMEDDNIDDLDDLEDFLEEDAAPDAEVEKAAQTMVAPSASGFFEAPTDDDPDATVFAGDPLPTPAPPAQAPAPARPAPPEAPPVAEENFFDDPPAAQPAKPAPAPTPPAAEENFFDDPPPPAPQAQKPLPQAEENFFDDPPAAEENFFDDPPAAPATQATPPAQEENFFDDPPADTATHAEDDPEMENFFEDPAPAGEVTRPTAQEKKGPRSKLPIIIGAAAIVVVGLIAVVFTLRSQAKKKFITEANLAFGDAIILEDDGKWDEALEAWAQVRQQYPDHQYGFDQVTADSRYQDLVRKIEARQQQAQDFVDRASAFVDQDILVGETDNNARHYINRVRDLDPENAALASLMDRLRTQQVDKARALIEEKKIIEAKEAYDTLRLIDIGFRDASLEADMNQWLQENVVDPELKKLDRAVERRRWDSAFKISEELRPKMPDPKQLDDFWDTVFVDYQQLYETAEKKGQSSRMLQALNVMARIRPADVDIVAQKDKLNRDINRNKITDLENQINRHIKRQQYDSALTKARSLGKLDSSNQVAKDAVATIRFKKKEEIDKIKKTNPRLALTRFEELLKIADWRDYRKERDMLKTRVAAFDSAVKSLQGMSNKSLDEQQNAINMLLQGNKDFQDDQDYKRLTSIAAQMEEEHNRLRQMIAYDRRVEGDTNKTYQSIIDTLKAQKKFSFRYARDRQQALIKKYQGKINNYEGPIAVVLKSASNLTLEKGRRPQGFITLETTDEHFRSELENLPSPSWNHISSFAAKSGDPIKIKIFQMVKKREVQIASFEIKKIPLSKKGIVLTGSDGKAKLTIDVRRER